MKYHPDIELLLKYSSGQLAPAISVAIGLHQEHCKECQQRIIDLESVGGDTLEALSISDSPSDLDNGFDLLMADLEATPQDNFQDKYDGYAVAQSDVDYLERLGKKDYWSFDWKRVTRKISRAVVDIDDGLHQVELLKFEPNAKIPKHTHEGEEFTLVLEGDFSDSNGCYREGEFIVQDQSDEHQPVAGSAGCVCLAITNAPLKFTGTLGPIINWFSRH
jgi:putative transcriptional regulator